MKNIVTFGIAYMTLFGCFQTMLTRTCVGRDGTSCCVGFRWDTAQEMCIPCDKGYMGPNCEIRCLFPSYGEGCQMICNCIEKDCDPANGCNNSSTEYPMSSSIGLEYKIVTTDLLNYEASISEICKEGYYGINCKLKCRFPSYGLACQQKCICMEKDCDHIKGCLLSAKEHSSPPSKDLQHNIATKEILKSNDFSKVTTNNDKTSCTAVKQNSKRTNYLKFALIGLAIVSIIIVFIYFHVRLLEKRYIIQMIV
ncbi:multiple epidermal growth factor-like domains protein 6 isoform X1 [Magallana gigas]|uniref:multiple epidermal growth factor-like domains protein 6 isoform X1 n=1 Tax=Magallana gigas TaxID=29159 RepID=UPI0033428D04